MAFGNANRNAEAKSRVVFVCVGVSGPQFVRVLHVPSQAGCSGAAVAIVLAPATQPAEITVHMHPKLIAKRMMKTTWIDYLHYALRYIGRYMA